MPAMSRVEGILDGTYTGRPLSRVEQLLMDGGTGGGGTDVSGIIQDISNLQTSLDEFKTDTNNDLQAMASGINELGVVSEQLVTHALTDAPLTLSK